MNGIVNTELSQSSVKKLTETDRNVINTSQTDVCSSSALNEYFKNSPRPSSTLEESRESCTGITNGIKTLSLSKEPKELKSLMELKLTCPTASQRSSLSSRLKRIRGRGSPVAESSSNLKLVNFDASKQINQNGKANLTALAFEKHTELERSTRRRNRPHLTSRNTATKNRQQIAEIKIDLDDLLRQKSVELIKYLIANITEFNDFLSQELQFNDITQTVFVLEKVYNAKTDLKFTKQIFTEIYGNFIKLLDSLLLNLSLDNDKSNNCQVYWNDPSHFWQTLRGCFDFMQTNIPDAKPLLFKTIKLCLLTIGIQKTSVNFSIGIENAFKEMFDGLLCKYRNQEEDSEDAFRLIDSIPSATEILVEKRQFIRKNVVTGPYKNVSHFLDTHFRLLREDFLAPLRSALSDYKNKTESKITDFVVYPGTQFIPAVEFDDDTRGRILRHRTYEIVRPGSFTKRHAAIGDSFMVGGLLLFSEDDFENMFLGIVKEKFQGGVVRVLILQTIPFLYKRKFTMLECTTYFGPYELVLKVLKQLDTEHFPMQSYILNVSNEQHPPAYLAVNTEYVLDDQQFVVLNPETWPSPNHLKLNEAQYEAFKYALTSQFSVIQGPPGTGKTYLGIKIAGALIKNKNLQKNCFPVKNLGIKASKPILVVAYTNHALDQFLEGILCYTKNVIRIGQRSKNPKISRLCFKGTYGRHNRDLYYSRISVTINQKATFLKELESILLYLGIYSFNRLAVSNSDLQSSKLSEKSDADVIKWLMGNRRTKEKRNEDWQMAKEISSQHKTLKSCSGNSEYYILTFAKLKIELAERKEFLTVKNSVELETIFEDWNRHQEDYDNLKDDFEYIHWRLSHAVEHSNLFGITPINLENLNQLNSNDRWILYFHWIDTHIDYLKGLLDTCNSKIQHLWEKVDISKEITDSSSIAYADVVGMTTSGAARHRTLLENLKCPIVIVEEAAEVLESYIIVSLTHHCQQLILLGDHKQLRPSTADYEIETDYKLGVSLFERMIINGVSYKTLQVQHRMRPEICNLIVPAIYTTLSNHSSVLELPNVIGIKSNVFFVTHQEPEEQYGNSKRNIHEAKYVVALAQHLILQGYTSEEITILTTYKGQMFLIKSERNKATFQLVHKVRVMTVDNFQGEENRIILLSLVRSNVQNRIGFIATENRICVALSRAKQGFYIIGNMDMLANGSKTWANIANVFRTKKQIGYGLELACHIHKDTITIAVKPSDFQNAPDGGCMRDCKAALDCGHKCMRKCHISDLDHEAYKCRQLCTKIICKRNHLCPKKCFEGCSITCEVLVERQLPCKHTAHLPCHFETEMYQCIVLASTLLDCGHLAEIPCCILNKTATRCDVEVDIVKEICGHTVKTICHRKNSDVNCTVPIFVTLNCGHEVVVNCFEQTKEILCRSFCSKLLQCGHVCSIVCHFPDDPEHREYRCYETCNKQKKDCQHAYKCTNRCYDKCSSCKYKIRLELPCGHWKIAMCGESDVQQQCKSYCRRVKECGHICYSRCHPHCPTLCSYQVFKKLPRCKHTIKMPCSNSASSQKCWKCQKL